MVIKDVKIPEPRDNEVLVKVYTSAVNPLDNMIIKKEVKLIVDYKTPFIMGNEFAGMIEKVGSNVSKFKVGDRVYARMPLDKIGTFAEYLTIDEKEICIIPDYLTFEEATAVPLTALTAMQAYKLLHVESGKKINLGKALLKTYMAYGFTGIILNNILSFIWIDKVGISKFIAPLINLIVSVPLNFIINKLWAFKSEDVN